MIHCQKFLPGKPLESMNAHETGIAGRITLYRRTREKQPAHGRAVLPLNLKHMVFVAGEDSQPSRKSAIRSLAQALDFYCAAIFKSKLFSHLAQHGSGKVPAIPRFFQ